jgi:protein TonB
MTNLQTTSDELKEASGRGTPQETAQPEAAEATHRPASDFKASGLVLPRYFSRKRGNVSPLTLPATVKKDVFLNALLEVPVAKPPRRSPLEWAGAMSVHLVILGALIIVPLYTTGTIHVPDYAAVPLIAPAPPPLPAPPAAATAPRVASRPKTELMYKLHRVTAPTAIPKRVDASAPPPDLGGIAGGVPGGVVGGEIGGVLGGTGSTAPTPAPVQKLAAKLVRVGSELKAPRQTYSVNPEYPPLALQAGIRGTVVVDAIIDEHGSVVQARAINGHPLLIAPALKAVLQWKYEPTSLNGQPISVELQVLVNFK